MLPLSMDGKQKNGERSALYFVLFGSRFGRQSAGEPPCSLSGVGPALWRGGTQACLLDIRRANPKLAAGV